MKKTVILWTRHEAHKKPIKNYLNPDAIKRTFEHGKKLKEMGFSVDVVVSSPQWRALHTAMEMLRGMGKMVPVSYVEPMIGDVSGDTSLPEDFGKQLKGMAKKSYGSANDANLATVMIKEPQFHDHMIRRGNEGAAALTKMATENPGKTVLATSHGVARMELSIQALKGIQGTDMLQIQDQLLDRGETVVLVFETDDAGETTFVQSYSPEDYQSMLAEEL